MVSAVVDKEGNTVHAVEKRDLDEAVEKFLHTVFRYVLFTMVPAMAVFIWTVSAYASDNKSYHEKQESRFLSDSVMIAQNRAATIENSHMRAQLDSLRIETRHLTEIVEGMDRSLRRIGR